LPQLLKYYGFATGCSTSNRKFQATESKAFAMSTGAALLVNLLASQVNISEITTMYAAALYKCALNFDLASPNGRALGLEVCQAFCY